MSRRGVGSRQRTLFARRIGIQRLGQMIHDRARASDGSQRDQVSKMWIADRTMKLGYWRREPRARPGRRIGQLGLRAGLVDASYLYKAIQVVQSRGSVHIADTV